MNIQFREPVNKQELEALFHLRHKVYSEDSLLHSMIPKDCSNIDLNFYDLNSLHFAAFVDDKPVACIRITTGNKTHFTSLVEELANEAKISTTGHKVVYPFQNFYPDQNWSLEFIQSLNGRKIGEVGRLAIHKDFRTGGLLFSNFIRSFIKYCKEEQAFSTGFGSCSLPLERFYRKFGFERASQPFVYKNLPEAVIVRFDS